VKKGQTPVDDLEREFGALGDQLEDVLRALPAGLPDRFVDRRLGQIAVPQRLLAMACVWSRSPSTTGLRPRRRCRAESGFGCARRNAGLAVVT